MVKRASENTRKQRAARPVVRLTRIVFMGGAATLLLFFACSPRLASARAMTEEGLTLGQTSPSAQSSSSLLPSALQWRSRAQPPARGFPSRLFGIREWRGDLFSFRRNASDVNGSIAERNGMPAPFGSGVLLAGVMALLAWAATSRHSASRTGGRRGSRQEGPPGHPRDDLAEEVSAVPEAPGETHGSPGAGAPPAGAGGSERLPVMRPVRGVAERMEEAGFVGFFEYRPDTDLLVATPGHYRLFGIPVSTAPSALGDWLKLLALPERDRILRSLFRAIVAQRRSTVIAYQLGAQGGQRKLVSHLSIGYLPNGQAERVSGVTTLAVPTRHDAVAGAPAVEELLAGVAHELRTPLGAMASSLEVIERFERDSEFSCKARGVLRRQLSRMTDLLDDLRELGDISCGRGPAHTEALELGAMASMAVSRVQCSVRPAPAMVLDAQAVRACADGQRVSQILVGVLERMAKRTPASGRIEVRTYAEEEMACVEVRALSVAPAHQPGVPPAGRECGGILGPRVTAASPWSPCWRASLFGSTLAHRFIESYGGNIEAENQLGGMRVTIRLPASWRSPEQRGKGAHETFAADQAEQAGS